MRVNEDTPYAELMEAFRDDLMIVFLKELKKMGHDLKFPVAQIDNVGGDVLSMAVDETQTFIFDVRESPANNQSKMQS